MKRKTKKGFMAITVTDSPLIYVYLFFIYVFIFDEIMFQEKKVPTVTTCNALHGAYNFFPMNPFLWKNFSDNLVPAVGDRGLALNETELS